MSWDREHDRYRLTAAFAAGEGRAEKVEKTRQAEAAAAVCIQTVVRRFVARAAARRLKLIRRYKAKKHAAVVLQARARAMVYRSRYLGAVEAVIRVQALVRGWLGRRRARVRRAQRAHELELEAIRRQWVGVEDEE